MFHFISLCSTGECTSPTEAAESAVGTARCLVEETPRFLKGRVK